MKLIFVRHGEALHNVNEPDSFQVSNPRLTQKGIEQAQSIKKHFYLTKEDIIVVSPTFRTIQTAQIFINDQYCQKFICYSIGPRIYPYRENAKTLPCDTVLSTEELKQYILNENFRILYGEFFNENLSSVNHIPEHIYQGIALSFIKWCKKQDIKRIFIVTHDGTINTFRELVLNKRFTREDMLNEGEFIILEV